MIRIVYLLVFQFFHLNIKSQNQIYSNNDAVLGISGRTRTIIKTSFDSSFYIGGAYSEINGCNSSYSLILKIEKNQLIPFAQFFEGTIVNDMVEFDSKLFIGGRFNGNLEGESYSNIAVWDGNKWSSLAGGLNGEVRDLEVDIQNQRIFAGGNFTNAGGNPEADKIAFWNGNNWEKFGRNKDLESGHISTIEMSQGGVVYIGGTISVNDSIQDIDSHGIGYWDGKYWRSLVEECEKFSAGADVRDIEEINGKIFVGGNFSYGCDTTRHNQNIIEYTGTHYKDIGTPIKFSPVNKVFDNNGELFIGGSFQNMGENKDVSYLSKLEGDKWIKLISNNGSDVYTINAQENILVFGGNFVNLDGIDGLNTIAYFGVPKLEENSVYSSYPSSKHIDSILLYKPKNDSIKNYHHYTVETELCQIDSIKCTKDRIWQIWLSDIANQIPIREDFIGLDKFVPIYFKEKIYNNPIDIGRVDEKIYTIENTFDRVKIGNIIKAIKPELCNEILLLNNKEDQINIEIDAEKMCVTNYTLPGHFLYPGRVERCLKVKNCNKIFVVTKGEGFHFCGNNNLGEVFSLLNRKIGIEAFSKVDQRLIIEILK